MGERLEHRGRRERGLDHGPGAGPVEHPRRRQRGQKERTRRQPPQAARHPAPRLGRVVQPDDHSERRREIESSRLNSPSRNRKASGSGTAPSPGRPRTRRSRARV